MFWNKKDKGPDLPDLPPMRPSFTTESFKIKMDKPESFNSGLPSFPDLSSDNLPAQNSMKDSFDSSEHEEIPLKEISRPFKTMEIPEISMPKSQESKPLPPPPTFQYTPIVQQQKNDIFVKIEKFQTARKSLSSATEKVSEIESLLRKIREVRMREEQELTAWEKEISDTKAKIETVTRNLFDKVE
ncbi:MAG: hypothetical protein AABW80_00295 [Nanoarchaeota archaeon]